MYAMPLEYFCEIPPLIACLAGGADADMDGLLEDIALRDAAALENAFYDLKGWPFRSCKAPKHTDTHRHTHTQTHTHRHTQTHTHTHRHTHTHIRTDTHTPTPCTEARAVALQP